MSQSTTPVQRPAQPLPCGCTPCRESCAADIIGRKLAQLHVVGPRHTFICAMTLAFCIRASQQEPKRRKNFIMPLMDCAPLTVTFARLVGAPVVDAGMLYLMIGIVVGCSFSASPSIARYCPGQHTSNSSYLTHWIITAGPSHRPSQVQMSCGIQAGLRGCTKEKSDVNRSCQNSMGLTAILWFLDAISVPSFLMLKRGLFGPGTRTTSTVPQIPWPKNVKKHTQRSILFVCRILATNNCPLLQLNAHKVLSGPIVQPINDMPAIDDVSIS